MNGGLCLDVYYSLTTAGTRVNQYTCNGGTNQVWSYNSVTQQIVSGLSSSSSSQYCLDISGSAIAAGSKLVLNPCTVSSTQKWSLGVTSNALNSSSPPAASLIPSSTPSLTFVLNMTAGAIDVAFVSALSTYHQNYVLDQHTFYSNVVDVFCADFPDPTQTWTFTNGVIQVTSDGNLCLTASTSSSVSLTSCASGSLAQQWGFNPTDNSLRPLSATGLCLTAGNGDVSSLSCGSSMPLALISCNTTAPYSLSQQWSMLVNPLGTHDNGWRGWRGH